RRRSNRRRHHRTSPIPRSEKDQRHPMIQSLSKATAVLRAAIHLTAVQFAVVGAAVFSITACGTTTPQIHPDTQPHITAEPTAPPPIVLPERATPDCLTNAGSESDPLSSILASSFYLDGTEIRRDDEHAAELLAKSCQANNNPLACAILASMLVTARGVEQ